MLLALSIHHHFKSAAVLTLDGVGEWTTTSLAIGKGKDLKVLEIHFPHSLDSYIQLLLTILVLE